MNRISTSMHPSQSLERAAVSQAEADRLEAVGRYSILDTPPEGAFDRITRLAAQLFDVPMAIVSIVDHDRIWFKAAHGVAGVSEIPREPGFCSSAIEQDGAYVVADALRDPRSASNSLVTGRFGLRFYVGVPLATSDGYNLGTLCVLDREPKDADPLKVEMLESLAKIVVDELELRLSARRIASETNRRQEAEARGAAAARSSLEDELTGLANRRALERELDALYDAFRRGELCEGAIVLVDVDGLKAVNDRRGHDVGDVLLRGFAAALQCAFPQARAYRYGGDEFVIVARTTVHAREVRAGVAEAVRSVREDGFPEADASFGVAPFADVDGSPRGAVRLADSRMYASKVSRR